MVIDGATARKGPGTFQAVLQLLRIPNVFTAVADVTMGYLVTHPGVRPLAPLVLLVAASATLYTSGVVLNDVFDAPQDAKERPQRPIPSGRVSLTGARLLGACLLLVGTVCGLMASLVSGDGRPALAVCLLAGCILLYNAAAKRTWWGPVVMGACRMLNVLLGMSLATGVLDGRGLVRSEPCLLIAAGVGVYVTGVTWFARTESRQSDRRQLFLATMVTLSGLCLLAQLPRIRPIDYSLTNWTLLWIVLAVMIGWRAVRAIFDPAPQLVQAAVKHAVLSLIFVDAAVCAGVCGAYPAIAILLLAIPATYLGRWIEIT